MIHMHMQLSKNYTFAIILYVYVTGFEKTRLPRTIVNNWKYQIQLFIPFHLGKAWSCTHEIFHKSIATYSLSVDQLVEGGIQLYKIFICHMNSQIGHTKSHFEL